MNVSPTNSGESLRSIIQKLKIIQNDCKNNGKDVKLSLCRDAEEVLKNASDIISKLEEKKNNAIVKEDVDEIKKISDKIVIIENRAIALCNLDILFQDRYTDEVIIPYDGLEKEKERIEKMDKEIKEKNEAENQKKKEQDKIKKIEMEKKIKEKKKEAMRDEYVKELNFSDNVKKNDVIVKSKVYHHLNESNKKDDENEYSNSSTSNSSEDEDSSDKKKSKSTNKTAGGDLEDGEFSKFINNSVDEILKPFDAKEYNTQSNKSGSKKTLVRKGPTEADVRAAMEKVKEEKYEEMNHTLDKYYMDIEKIIDGDN